MLRAEHAAPPMPCAIEHHDDARSVRDAGECVSIVLHQHARKHTAPKRRGGRVDVPACGALEEILLHFSAPRVLQTHLRGNFRLEVRQLCLGRAGKVLGSLETPQEVVKTTLTIESIGNPTI